MYLPCGIIDKQFVNQNFGKANTLGVFQSHLRFFEFLSFSCCFLRSYMPDCQNTSRDSTRGEEEYGNVRHFTKPSRIILTCLLNTHTHTHTLKTPEARYTDSIL